MELPVKVKFDAEKLSLCIAVSGEFPTTAILPGMVFDIEGKKRDRDTIAGPFADIGETISIDVTEMPM